MNRTPIHIKHDIIPYCATCKKSWDADEKRRLRQRFLCPCDNGQSEPHIAACVKGDVGKKWLHIEKLIINYEFRTIFIFKWFFKTPTPLQNISIYLVLILAFLALKTQLINFIITIILSGFLVIHLLLVSTSITFFSRFPAHPLRSVINVLHTFLLTIFSFSLIFFAIRGSDNFGGQGVNGIVDAIYFSMVTITTLGYGDIFPISALCKIIVMVELGVGIYLLAIILTVFTSWINDNPDITDIPTYYQLFPERLINNN